MKTTPASRPRRSLLYVPADKPRALEKAAGLDIDGVIVDLEDSVAPDAKATGRAGALAALKPRAFPPHMEVVLRVNGLGTPWGEEDLKAAAGLDVDAVLVPKIAGRADLETARAALTAAGAPAVRPLWAMMEMPRAILSVREIAEAAEALGLTVLVVGGNDLAKELRAGTRAALVPALAQILLGARMAGLGALDAVYNAIADEAGFAAECAEGRDLGFDGKTLIHPGQVAPANAAFTPAPEAVDWARKVVEAFAQPEASGKGVIALDGMMVERLHLDDAVRMVAIADELSSRTPIG